MSDTVKNFVAPDLINDPPHYKTKSGVEAIHIIEAFGLNYHVGNAVAYLLRHERKGDPLSDLRKAKWFIDREISRREGNR